MKFVEIKLNNFRQFRGEQSVALDTTESQPVAMFFGANGSGKTTLLNAFTWCLYGEMSDDVEQQERLITDSAWSVVPLGSEALASVEITFEHEDSKYVARRVSKVLKESESQRTTGSTLSLKKIDKSGASDDVAAPQETVDTILPKGLSAFFFFNGERIEKLTNRGSYIEIRDDIKALLGLEQVERALNDLPKVDRKLGADLRKHGGEHAAVLQKAIDAEQLKLDDAGERLESAQSNKVSLKAERDGVLEELRMHSGVAELQKSFDAAEDEMIDARAKWERATHEKSALLAKLGFTAFMSALSKETAEAAATLYEKGTLPAPLKRDFVDQLLDARECICGTALVEGSAPWGQVSDWRERAGLAAVEAGWQRLQLQAEDASKARDDLRARLRELIVRTSDAQQLFYRAEEKRARAAKQLKGSPLTDVNALSAKREDLDAQIERASSAAAIAERDRQTSNASLSKLEGEQTKAAVADALAQKAQDRLNLVRSVKAALEEILEIRSRDMRDRLDAKVKQVFAAITNKPYVPELSTDFELKLFQATDQGRISVPKSTGENQILSLSFVAAVSELAREVRREKDEHGGGLGDLGTYPIVMDAAFGSLDETYQEEVSRALAGMAPQLVVLVSKSQGLGTVLSVLESKVHRLGIVVTHSSNEVRDPEEIELEGRNYPYVTTKDQADWSELKEIK